MAYSYIFTLCLKSSKEPVSFTFFLSKGGMGWVWVGYGNEMGIYGDFFIGRWKGGLHSDFACFIVQPFMCLAPAEPDTRKRFECKCI